MSYGIICRQKGCGGCRNLASFRFTWPGCNESYVCDEHAEKLKGVASAIGMHFQLIALTSDEHRGPIGMQSIEEQMKAEQYR